MNKVAMKSVSEAPKPAAQGHAHSTKLQLKQDSSFSYACNRCKRCCRAYEISVTPFDLLRLADNLGVTTTEVIEQHLDGNNHLQRKKDGACKFLADEGCSVHGGRPLVCRMYPLVRNVTDNGEWFSTLEPVPQSAAEWGLDGTVAGYLERQDAMPSIEGYNLYSRLHYRIEQRFKQALAEVSNTNQVAVEPLNLGLFPGSILDPDPSVQAYCRHHDLPLPTSLRHKAACHVLAIEQWVDLKLKEASHD